MATPVLAGRVRRLVRVEGIVQGVGFRPYVALLAERLGVGGCVGNDSAGVFIDVEGAPDAVEAFLMALPREAPPLAVVERLTVTPAPPDGASTFRIADSTLGGTRQTLISPDIATCEDCLRELFDPADRRYRYPFVNCTDCGPRFTIVRDVPYDRARTTMAGFPMCAACATEYADPHDRRFHAQPVCCPECGPRLRLVDPRGDGMGGDPIVRTAVLLADGQVVAVKGLGGYHLAALASCEDAVAALRTRKAREDKPFAVMAADLPAAARLAEVDDAARELLTCPRRPIVLLPRRADAPLATPVAPGNRRIGVMLPYTPLHHLLAAELGEPFVLTSGNVRDEPIAYRDDDALTRLAGVADAFLLHDRPIETRTDDSVVRIQRLAGRGFPYPIRRSRGYAPQPLALPSSVARPVLAVGAELKNTFCLVTGHHAFVSHHIGDLENAETLRSFTEGIAHFRRLFDVQPDVVAHDLHPEYLSTKYAMDLADQDESLALVGVQHHHAHIASCLADNGETGPVIGVAFDGLGYGTDGTLWGGELLVADLSGFNRATHLRTVPMPGAAAAVRQPWRMAAAWLDATFPDGMPVDLGVLSRHDDTWPTLLSAARRGVASPQTSSVGRLFDAVAALLDVRDVVNYEGQAAVELEQLADVDETSGYPMGRVPADDCSLGWAWDPAPLIAALLEDVAAGVDRSRIAGRFHASVAAAVVDACAELRDLTGVDAVALSGGVWQNELLLSRTVPGLQAGGFRVLLHERVPCNDGGISLGQVAVAAGHVQHVQHVQHDRD